MNKGAVKNSFFVLLRFMLGFFALLKSLACTRLTPASFPLWLTSPVRNNPSVSQIKIRIVFAVLVLTASIALNLTAP